MKLMTLLSSNEDEDYKITEGLNLLSFKTTYTDLIEVKKNIFEKVIDFFKRTFKKQIKPKYIQIEKEKDLTLEIKSLILNDIMQYLFKNNKSSGKKVFDLELDYRYYYCDFLKMGIDLNKDDISWWEFDAILEGILLKKDSVISTVLSFRTYKKPSKNIKTYEQEEHKYYTQKQRQYALPSSQEELEQGMNKMWDYVSQKSDNLQ